MYLSLEDNTMNLGLAVVNHALLYTQAADLATPVQIYQQIRATIAIGQETVTVTNDGGLNILSSSGQQVKQSVVAFEAKRVEDNAITHRFACTDDEGSTHCLVVGGERRPWGLYIHTGYSCV
ncbi:hypothetical protein ACHAP5_011397 [Fusarium lateritium]